MHCGHDVGQPVHFAHQIVVHFDVDALDYVAFAHVIHCVAHDGCLGVDFLDECCLDERCHDGCLDVGYPDEVLHDALDVARGDVLDVLFVQLPQLHAGLERVHDYHVVYCYVAFYCCYAVGALLFQRDLYHHEYHF